MKAATLNRVAPEKEYTPLFSAVITQAIEDLKSKDITRALDAMLFLRGGDFPIWAEAAGLPDIEFKIALVPKAWKQIARSRIYQRRKNDTNRRTKTLDN